MHRRPAKESGFTIVESAIALFLLSLALLTLMSEFILVSRSVHSAKNRTNATYLAQAMLERLTNEALDSLMLYEKVDTRDLSTYPVDTAANDIIDDWATCLKDELRPGSFGTIAVESPVKVGTAGTEVDGLTRITVVVCWPTTDGRTSDVKLVLIRRS